MLSPFKHKNVKKYTFLFLKLKKYNFYETIHSQLAQYYVKTRRKVPIFYDFYENNRPYQ